MATDTKSKASTGNKKRKTYLPHNRPVKKGSYPLRPGIQGFFITCDGGREFQAAQEALNVLDSFFEELVSGEKSNSPAAEPLKLAENKKTKFVYSDSDEDEDGDEDKSNEEREDAAANNIEHKDTSVNDDVGEGNIGASLDEKLGTEKKDDQSHEEQSIEKTNDEKEDGNHENQVVDGEPPSKKQTIEKTNDEKEGGNHENQVVDGEPPSKKHRVETVALPCLKSESSKVEEKSIDQLIEAELAELGDKSKRRFNKLDSGCNGVIFIQMRMKDGDPSPKDIAQHMMSSLASTRKHVSRFMLRVLPIELACYASEEEITRAMKPLIEKYFPVDTENSHKFAVLYDARANTGIDRMKIINAVAKSVPQPHTVDLSNPDKHIVVQICKTVCLIGVVEKYKELAKFNMRQLSSPKP